VPGTNDPKRAILYARVSTEEQARTGYSLAQQIEALRAYAASEGFEVVEEVLDPGYSGAGLERPGMDRVRDLVAGTPGGVSVVLAQDRDRFSREPAYHYLLRRELEERGCRLKALNDRGDETPEGELTDGILDQLAKYERAKLAERTRRGMLRKVREGNPNVTGRPSYGFRYNAARDAMVVHDGEMAVVAEIFGLVARGWGLHRVQSRLYAEGVPSPTGKPLWDVQMIRKLVKADVYRPHTHAEISEMVSPEVAARLDPDLSYGVQWYNRQKVTERTVSEPDAGSPGGRRYRKKRTFTARPREEWVAIPVPASERLSRELVDRARESYAASKGTERKYQSRPWELRGLMRCPCGASMTTRNAKAKDRPYHYYTCRRRGADKKVRGCTQKDVRAEKAEAAVWSFVSGLLKDPERVRAGMEELIERERSSRGLGEDPEQEALAWSRKLEECARMRSAYQDQQAAGLLTLQELGEKLAGLEETRRIAHAELDALGDRRSRLEELEEDRDVLLSSYAGMLPEGLDALSGEERNVVYRMLRLEVTPTPEGFEVRGVFSSLETRPAPPPWRVSPPAGKDRRI